MFEAAWPQIVAYVGLNGLFTLLYPTHIDLPAEAPSALRFASELATCFIIGDFNIYW